jgi:hypothetical protein
VSESDPTTPVTHHAEARGKERAGLNRKALERTADKARTQGLRRKDAAGRLARYLDKLAITHPGKVPVIYGQHVYVFAGEVLITVMELPHEFRRAAADCLKKRKH